ncbi:MAG: hypothetical protein AUJ96_19335 [Armatimonadetes bacterium CG2_30_66_41]|nr:MAG: hypothetical protein AUJ96_19335 [Armatimonadetes bacterium CG2_30_66_41]
MAIEDLARDLLSLPVPSRAFLAEKLTESVDYFVSPSVEAAWRAEIGKRVRDYEDGVAGSVPSEAAFAEARKRADEAR